MRLNVSRVVPFRKCFQKDLRDDSQDRVACLITDDVWHFSQAVGDELKIPRIMLRCTASLSSLLAQYASSISRLNKQRPKSVIYVSLGSIASIDEAKFLEIAWGLANSEQPFLWVVRPGSICGSDWFEHLPSTFLEMINGRDHIVKRAPQQEVLAHWAIGGFWTHFGWNSTLESICEGVPIIYMPSFGDQKVNRRYVRNFWRVGLQLEYKLESGETERAIIKLLADPEGEDIRDRAVRL
ncbi:UDP-glycosyltransferase 76B1-like [Eucalyptus grandis]|uniref:UDP-glycosyltransferase 76B1-like n=1 Tax=Eucalyptus grandis TaxID=71139 RepID=UPI00192EEFA7|nr:UDP-glycosyltransferase 76B1-like [Eucalyptus grandis]